MTHVREAAVTAAAAACSVALLHGAPNLNVVARSAASASLATQRIVNEGTANEDESDEDVEATSDEDLD